MKELDDSHCRPLGDRLVERMEKMGDRKIDAFLKKGKGEEGGETEYHLPWIWYNVSGQSGAEMTKGAQCDWR